MTLNEAYPLILFTLLSGTAFGLWVAMFVVQSGARGSDGQERMVRGAGWLAVFLQAIAVVISLLHLSQPLAFYRALINWQTSWLTREGWCAGLFFGAIAVYLILYEWGKRGKILPAWLLPVIGGFGVLVGLGMSFSSGMIYVDATGYPGWGNPAVVFFFPVTSLAVGIALAFGLWFIQSGNRPPAESRFFAIFSLVLAMVATLAIYATFFVPGSLMVKMPEWQWFVIALLVLVTWIAYFLMLVKSQFLVPLWVWVAFVAFAVCVTLTRVWFYTYAVHL